MLPCYRLQQSLIRSSRARAALVSGFKVHTISTCRTFSVTARARQFIPDADEDAFKQHITNARDSDKLILVDFYEDWCPPCKVLTPLLREIEGDPTLIGAPKGSLDLITIKGETVPDLAREYQIRAVPTVIAFKSGSVVGQFVGALPLPGIKSWYSTLKK